MATVVLVPMLFAPGEAPSPPTEVSVAAASPDHALMPDDVRADAYGRWDDLEIAVAAVPEPTTTTSEAPLPTTTTVEVSTTTAPPTTTTEPPTTTTTTTKVTVAEVAPPPARPETATTTHTHPEPAPGSTTDTASAPDDGARSQEGQASWYDLPGSRAGVCAHRTIAKGTVVTVTNLDTGKSIECTVDDRGPYAEGKIIDLYRDDFARLAPLEQGVFPTRITW